LIRITEEGDLGAAGLAEITQVVAVMLEKRPFDRVLGHL
jgi:hypothetical protein